ncbi:MAG: IS982 family transposase [Bacteroidetes bacterium]|nr:MAG: IS982 family transposase [Bacteroidota bacterium]
MNLTQLFCHVDDFCQAFEADWVRHQLTTGQRRRRRSGQLCLSEVMTLLIWFHQSHYRNFKAFYVEHVCKHLRAAFPGLVSYSRFVELIPSTLIPLCAYLRQCQGACTGISFIDSTPLAVCHPRRIHQHRLFAGMAQRGKSSTGWFFGFKVHLVFNDRGELLKVALTPGNVDDRKPVPKLVQDLFGKLFADRGYISQKLCRALKELFDLQLITKLKANMKNQLMPLADKVLLRKRAIIETIIDQLKNISQIEHTRHRSPVNFMVNLLCGLIAYCHQPKKPALKLEPMALLEVA